MKLPTNYDAQKMSPDESKPIAYDYQGEAIYAGDEVYQTDYGLVLKDDETDFVKETFGVSFHITKEDLN